MNSILYWNEVALEANKVSHTIKNDEQMGPPLSARALAIVHLAMYDAYAGVLNNAATHPPYLSTLPAPAPGASIKAAVSAAAHEALSTLYPTQRSYFNQRLGEAGLAGAGLLEGRDFGVMVANAILADRANDPSVGDLGYVPSPQRGRHRVDPDNPTQGFHAPYYGQTARCFSSARLVLDSPPSPNLGSPTYAEYVRALKDVRKKGIAPKLMGTVTGDKRKVDELVIGLFWGYDGAVDLGTPPRLYNKIVREVSKAKNVGRTDDEAEADDARLFSLINVAMADAGILAWQEKYKHDLWRPVVGIREHDLSMGPSAMVGEDDILDDCDPEWLPLGAPSTNAVNKIVIPNHSYPCQEVIGDSGVPKNFTPNFPSYPSGHATFGAAALHMTRLFYNVAAGDKAPDDLFDGLTIVSEEMNGHSKDNTGTVRPNHVRAFPDGLWQMILENGRARVYIGVHWVFDAFAVDDKNKPDFSQNVGGVPLGLNIAESIYSSGGGLAPKKV